MKKYDFEPFKGLFTDKQLRDFESCQETITAIIYLARVFLKSSSQQMLVHFRNKQHDELGDIRTARSISAEIYKGAQLMERHAELLHVAHQRAEQIVKMRIAEVATGKRFRRGALVAPVQNVSRSAG